VDTKTARWSHNQGYTEEYTHTHTKLDHVLMCTERWWMKYHDLLVGQESSLSPTAIISPHTGQKKMILAGWNSVLNVQPEGPWRQHWALLIVRSLVPPQWEAPVMIWMWAIETRCLLGAHPGSHELITLVMLVNVLETQTTGAHRLWEKLQLVV
jgi:hypothetical protein